jgi:hypothetical protein
MISLLHSLSEYSPEDINLLHNFAALKGVDWNEASEEQKDQVTREIETDIQGIITALDQKYTQEEDSKHWRMIQESDYNISLLQKYPSIADDLYVLLEEYLASLINNNL